MMMRNRAKPVQFAQGPVEDQAPEPQPSEPGDPSEDRPTSGEAEAIVIPEPYPWLTDDASSEEISTAAGHHRQVAAGLHEQAGHVEARVEEIRTTAEAERARITAEEEAQAGPLTAAAAVARKEAGDHAECADRLARAAELAVESEAKDAAVAALEAERDELIRQQAALDGRLAALATQRGDLEPQLAAAIEDSDLSRVTGIRGQLDGIGAMEAAARGQLVPIVARLDAIGDGEMSPLWPQRELAEARRVAGHSQVHAALNYAQPDRPEAVAAREAENRRLGAAWLAEHRPPPAHRTVQVSPGGAMVTQTGRPA